MQQINLEENYNLYTKWRGIVVRMKSKWPMLVKPFGIVLLLGSFLVSFTKSSAQGTTAFGVHVGLSAAFYKSLVPSEKSQQTYFLPHCNAEIKRSGQNVFYGSFGIGIVPRRVTFYRYENGDKFGLEAPEGYAFVKTGLQARSNYLTHLPYLMLGVSRMFNPSGYMDISNATLGVDTGKYNPYLQFKPFMEVGNTMLNSTYTEDRRNVLLTLSFRYYPLALFKNNIVYQLDFNDIRQINYQLFELIITMGIQHNFHHKDY